MFAIAYLFGLLLLSLGLNVAMLHAAAKLLRLPTASWKRAAAVVGVLMVVNSALFVAMYWVEHSLKPIQAVFVLLSLLILEVSLFLLICRTAYRASGKQLWGFFALLFVMGLSGYALAYPFKWYIAEAFRIPLNSMAPTICGHRWEAICPKCGGMTVATIYDDEEEPGGHEEPELQCVLCRHRTKQSEIAAVEKFDDRIVAEKLRSCGRWDLIVFKNPEHPEQNYIKRVVGMPGEEIVIRDGFAFADGVKLEPPANCDFLRYTARPGEDDPRWGPANYDRQPVWGDPKRPIKLAVDEYFMLGDNTEHSLDGRFWGPVKREAVIGVATWLYWPPSRWKIFK